MKTNSLKKISMASVVAVIALLAGVIVGCQKEEEETFSSSENIPTELKNYFNSVDYADLKNSFGFKISDFMFDNVITENPIPEISIYYVPVRTKSKYCI
jgi:hypothetical protein